MANDLTESTIRAALDFAYDKAVNGVAGMDSASEIAETYMKRGGSKRDQANSLIRWQCTKAGTSGFLMGLGGLAVLPVTIPANLTSVLYIQMRMIAAVAHIGGHDLKNDRIRTFVYLCLTGNTAKDILKDIGIVVGRKLTENAIKSISGKTLMKINQRVGFRFITKFGQTGAVNLWRVVPVAGGVVGAIFDTGSTGIIGRLARDIFLPEEDS